MIGFVGREVTVEQGRELVKMCALSMLSALKNELGDLDKIDKIVKLEVYIEVADAASELFIELFGEDGRATRTVTPQNDISPIAVELDLVVYVKDN